jgi:hypothetical protein
MSAEPKRVVVAGASQPGRVTSDIGFLGLVALDALSPLSLLFTRLDMLRLDEVW